MDLSIRRVLSVIKFLRQPLGRGVKNRSNLFGDRWLGTAQEEILHQEWCIVKNISSLGLVSVEGGDSLMILSFLKRFKDRSLIDLSLFWFSNYCILIA